MDVDEDHDDSGVDTFNTDNDSITSSNYTFREQWSRRYHGINNVYALPNDEQEVIRLDHIQEMIMGVYGRNVLPHITREPTLILDLGTGSGRWAIEVSDDFPTARVIGIDLSPIQPTMVPLKCEFLVADFTKDLVEFGDGSVDLVHSRFVTAGIKKNEWSGYINEIFRILKPGIGWAQCVECNLPTWEGDIPEGSLFAQFQKMERIVFENRRNCIFNGEHLEQRFIDAGFVDIRVIKKVVELGDWRGEPGLVHVRHMAKHIFCELIPAVSLLFDEWYPDEEERNEFGTSVARELQHADHHLYFTIFMVIGRKPSVFISAEGKMIT